MKNKPLYETFTFACLYFGACDKKKHQIKLTVLPPQKIDQL